MRLPSNRPDRAAPCGWPLVHCRKELLQSHSQVWSWVEGQFLVRTGSAEWSACYGWESLDLQV